MLFLVIYFCASLMMPTLRIPRGHRDYVGRGLISVTERMKDNAVPATEIGERALAFSTQ